MAEKFSTRVFRLMQARKAQGRKLNKSELAKSLVTSRTMLYNYENSDPEPEGEILSRLSELEIDAGIEQMSTDLVSVVSESEPEDLFEAKRDSKERTIPIVGMAHAGVHEDYDEQVQEWRDTMVTTCPDYDAKGIRVIGICMSPNIQEDDVLVLMPSRRPQPGGVSVARIKDGGVIIRRFQFGINGKVTAMADNVQVPVEYYTEEDFEWIWPVWDMHRKIWRD